MPDFIRTCPRSIRAGADEAGYPWETDYTRINPKYFDAADLRIQELVNRGLAPCIVGCWGYFLGFMGMAKIKQHWRNIVGPVGRLPGHLVPRGRGHHALLPIQE